VAEAVALSILRINCQVWDGGVLGMVVSEMGKAIASGILPNLQLPLDDILPAWTKIVCTPLEKTIKGGC
jgi:hypothetical protein